MMCLHVEDQVWLWSSHRRWLQEIKKLSRESHSDYEGSSMIHSDSANYYRAFALYQAPSQVLYVCPIIYSLSHPMRKVLLWTPFRDEKTKAQRTEGACVSHKVRSCIQAMWCPIPGSSPLLPTWARLNQTPRCPARSKAPGD